MKRITLEVITFYSKILQQNLSVRTFNPTRLLFLMIMTDLWFPCVGKCDILSNRKFHSQFLTVTAQQTSQHNCDDMKHTLHGLGWTAKELMSNKDKNALLALHI